MEEVTRKKENRKPTFDPERQTYPGQPVPLQNAPDEIEAAKELRAGTWPGAGSSGGADR